MTATATPEQREQAAKTDFRSNTERDAELVRLRVEVAALRAEVERLKEAAWKYEDLCK